MKHLKRYFYGLLIALFFMPIGAATAEKTASPEAVVTAFYKWYIQHNNDKIIPLDSSVIYKHVATNAVARIRKEYAAADPVDHDYFLKVQDYDEQDWINNTRVNPAILLGDKAVVVVSFGEKKKINVIVVLIKEDSRWKIQKVIDTLG